MVAVERARAAGDVDGSAAAAHRAHAFCDSSALGGALRGDVGGVDHLPGRPARAAERLSAAHLARGGGAVWSALRGGDDLAKPGDQRPARASARSVAGGSDDVASPAVRAPKYFSLSP